MSLKKVAITILIIALSVAIVPTVITIFAFCLPAQYDMSFYGGMKIKNDRLNSIEGRKIVIIGGSSVAFGVRSDLMEQELKIPIVNFGLYANLGTKFMLDVAKDSISKGDIVIIAPEQNKQALSNYFNGEAVWCSADGNFGVLNKVSFSDVGELAKSCLAFTSNKFGFWRSGKKPYPTGVYNVNSFNAYGDICYARPFNTMDGGYDEGTPIPFDKDVISDEFIDYLNKYSKKLAKRGASVYFSFCPMNKLAVAQGEEEILTYTKSLEERLTFDLLGNPMTRIMDSEWFFDSNFHLNDSGSVMYTKQLIQDIKAVLDDYTAISLKVPDKPHVDKEPDDNAGDDVLSGELAEAAKIFALSGVEIFTQNGQVILNGSWTIEGLTDYGKTLTEIKIPDTIDGVSVTSIAAGAFANNTTVQKITFGLNVTSVGLNAFNGCNALQGIYITSLDANSFHPYEGILNGADNCSFYVPKDVYATEYLTDYFWGAFNKRMKSY